MKTNHHQLCMALFAVTLLASTAPATIEEYHNFTDWLNAGATADSYCSFANFEYGDPLNGTKTDWVYADDSYGFNAHANLGLWSNPGALSTRVASDPLVFTFMNSPLGVQSFGGYFAGQDLVFTLTDGLNDVTQVTITGNEQFVGFMSRGVLLTQVTLEGVDCPQVYGIYVDSPEPTTLVLLALGGCALLKKRRA
jgi:hypothetical protein